MTALAANATRKRETSAFDQRADNYASGTVGSAQIYVSSLVCYDTNDDTIKVGATSTTLVALGVAMTESPAGYTTQPDCEAGVFAFANSAAADEIADSDAGSDCYIVDDNTVALTDGTPTRSVAGKIVRVDDDGVWVRISPYI